MKPDSEFHHPVRLFWPKSCSFDYLYSDGEILLQNFPVQATINLYEDSDSEEEEEEEEKDKEEEKKEETDGRRPEECVRVPGIPAGPRVLSPHRKPDFWLHLPGHQHRIQAQWRHLSEESCRRGRGHLGNRIALGTSLHFACYPLGSVCWYEMKQEKNKRDGVPFSWNCADFLTELCPCCEATGRGSETSSRPIHRPTRGQLTESTPWGYRARLSLSTCEISQA
ncbi:protein ripply1 isoform X2 [Ursus arctos]|nr:protein ripply1 isoform X2 [Ursus arctos]